MTHEGEATANDPIHELDLRVSAIESARNSDVKLVGAIFTTGSALVGVIAYLFFSFIDHRIPPETSSRACDASRKASMGLHRFFNFQIAYLEREEQEKVFQIRSLEGAIRSSQNPNLEAPLPPAGPDSLRELRDLEDRIKQIQSEINTIKADKDAVEHFLSVCSEPDV